MPNHRGFSLKGLLIIIVMLGVLAGIAASIYTTRLEKAKSVEVVSHLQAARESMFRFFAENGTYVGAVITREAAAGTTIDYNPNFAAGSQAPLFSYTLSPSPTDTTFTIVASRVGKSVDTISINQAGVIVKTGVYS